MKALVPSILAACCLAAAAPVLAQCYGSETVKTCYDGSGNTYNVQRVGSQTFVDGSNAQTGSHWSQQTTTVGNASFTNGIAANGNTWHETTTRVGNAIISSGVDSNGNPFSSTEYINQSYPTYQQDQPQDSFDYGF